MASEVPPHPLPLSTKVNQEAIEKAVNALLKWNKAKSATQKPQLLDQDHFFYLILTLKRIPAKGSTNPTKIPLPHALHSPTSSELCLIIDDRSKSNLTSAAAKKKVQSENIPVSKVLKLSKLKSDYREFEKKRKLCDSYDMFFADKRIVPLLPKLLGKQFFNKKKIPITVNLAHKNWKGQIEKACGSAMLFLKTGTCSVLRVGRVSMEKEEIVENVVAAINGVADVVPRKWGNVRSFHLKLLESVALPVYQAFPDTSLKIEGVQSSELSMKSSEQRTKKKAEGEGKSGGKVSENGKKLGKKGNLRIHEIRYMDNEIENGNDVDADDDELLKRVEVDMGGAESGSENEDIKEAEEEEMSADESEDKKKRKGASVKAEVPAKKVKSLEKTIKKGDGSKQKTKKNSGIKKDTSAIKDKKSKVKKLKSGEKVKANKSKKMVASD